MSTSMAASCYSTRMNEPTNRDARSSGDYRVIIDSIGRADASLIATLGKALSPSYERLAELLLQAPSILLDGVSRELAEQTVALLSQTGVVIRSAPMHE